jgi:DNA-directed RNA polymerase subunit RPC12/RpoP
MRVDAAESNLRCVECGRKQAAEERGWRAFLTVDDADDDEPVEAVVYCPECASREFGAPGDSV